MWQYNDKIAEVMSLAVACNASSGIHIALQRTWQLAGLPERNEGSAQSQSNRSTEDESTCLKTCTRASVNVG